VLHGVSLTDNTGETKVWSSTIITAHNPAHVSIKRKGCPPIASDKQCRLSRLLHCQRCVGGHAASSRAAQQRLVSDDDTSLVL
jgi:hypothetical protein